MKEKIFLLVVTVLSTFITNAQLVAEYTFGNTTVTQTNLPSFVNYTILSNASGVNVGVGQLPGFATGNPGRSRWAQYWTTASTPNLNQYFRLTLTKALSTDVKITGIDFYESRSNAGPRTIQIRTSADGFSSVVWQQSIPSNQLWRSWIIPVNIQIVPASLEIRFYAFDNEGVNGDGAWRIDNLRIYAEITNLPIKLISFTGEKVGRNTELAWTTASEQNNEYFTVFRSRDTHEWVEIAEVLGAGTSQIPLNYGIIDTSPFIGTNYYKLRQTDFDGTFVDSQVIAVDVDVGDEFVVYPNPVQRGVMFQTSLKVSYIADAAGRFVPFENNIIENPGFYTLVHIDESGDVTNCRIIVE